MLTVTKSLSLSLLWNFSKLALLPYIRSGLFDRVKTLVLEMTDEDIEGKEKQRKVREWLDVEYEHVIGGVKNLVIELAVARLTLPNK